MLPLTRADFPFRSLQMGERKHAHPYMGNIQMDVFPFKENCRFRKEPRAVNTISMHQPRIPQWIKLWIYFFIGISMSRKG